MKILITGVSGNIGHYFAGYFSSKKIKVVGIDSKDTGKIKENPYYTFYKCDIRDKNKLKSIFDNEKPSHVIHLAFLMKPLHNKKANYDIDVVGTINALNLANETSSVKQFIEYSSTSAYGGWKDNPLGIKEEAELKPRDYRYGIHKKIIEKYISDFKKRKGLKIVIVRMCTVIGEDTIKKSVMYRIYSSKILPGFYKKIKLQFIHENDMTALIEKIIKDKKIEGIFNLAPDSYATVEELSPGKIFIPIPLSLMKFFTWILWHLRIARMMPSAITLSAHSIVASPEKLKKRYNYKFKYTTKSAFDHVVSEMKKKGLIR